MTSSHHNSTCPPSVTKASSNTESEREKDKPFTHHDEKESRSRCTAIVLLPKVSITEAKMTLEYVCICGLQLRRTLL